MRQILVGSNRIGVTVIAASLLALDSFSQAVGPSEAPYAVVSRDANQRVWERTEYETQLDGSRIPSVHQVVELATGMHYLKASPGAATSLWLADRLNLSGNTLTSGGCGLKLRSACTNLLVLKNDFSAAEQLALDGIGRLGEDGIDSSGALLSSQIIKNDLGSGVSFHINAPIQDGTHWFLRQNSYLDSSGSPINLFPEPLALPVHYQP